MMKNKKEAKREFRFASFCATAQLRVCRLIAGISAAVSVRLNGLKVH